jgi:hypothetical protein
MVHSAELNLLLFYDFLWMCAVNAYKKKNLFVLGAPQVTLFITFIKAYFKLTVIVLIRNNFLPWRLTASYL